MRQAAASPFSNDRWTCLTFVFSCFLCLHVFVWHVFVLFCLCVVFVGGLCFCFLFFFAACFFLLSFTLIFTKMYAYLSRFKFKLCNLIGLQL